MALSKQQIGKCGELLVQFELLKRGIESSRMTTDAGVDLVVYSPKKKDAITIQVKTNLKPKPSGGKGKLALDWCVPIKNEAEIIALVELDTYKIWLIPWSDFQKLAQQKSDKQFHFYMYVDPSAKDRPDNRPHREFEFSHFLIENMIHSW
jgi:hypothetical protein